MDVHHGETPQAAARIGSDAVERVVLLDEAGQPIGTMPKHLAHGASTPYHLAFSCYAFNAQDEILVTRRALTKLTWPGVRSNTCCGHPAPGEDLRTAVTRRMGQELNLRPEALELALPDFSYRATMDGVVEHELCPVFLCRVYDQPRPNPDEVDSYSWWPWKRFALAATARRTDLSSDNDPLSPWAVLQTARLQVGGHVSQYLNLTRETTGRPPAL